MPRHPSHEDWLRATRTERPPQYTEGLLKFADLLGRCAAEGEFSDLLKSQKHGKLNAPPEPD